MAVHLPDRPTAAPRPVDTPTDISARGWVDIGRRTVRQVKSDNLSIVSGGVAFFGFVALFPAMIAALSLYGLVSSPSDVVDQIDNLSNGLPHSTRTLLVDQLQGVASSANSSLTVGFLVSVLAALYAASKGMKALVEGINIAYDEREDRGFLKVRLIAYGLTVGAVLLVVMTVALITVLPSLGDDLLGSAGTTIASVVRWPLLTVTMLLGLAIIYRFAPARAEPRWEWVSPGSVAATVLWIVGSVLFAVYVNNFGSYDETYGSIGAIIVLMLWIYLTAFVVLLGAELNGESERQAGIDPDLDRSGT